MPTPAPSHSDATPDGGQMLLLAGFIVAAAAILAIGTFAMLDQTQNRLDVQQDSNVLDVFLNTRERAQDYFDLVSANDTAISVENNINGYLSSQTRTANALSLQLNISLAGQGTASPATESDYLADLDGDATDEYADPDGGTLWSQDGTTCYSGIESDGTNDGLIVEDGQVVAAFFWLKIESQDASLEEVLVIDISSTTPAATC